MELQDIKDEKDLISFGDDFFQKSAKAKRKYERQWRLNIAFIAGDQLVQINRITNKLDRLRVEYEPKWMIHTVDNRILPIYRTICAKLTKNKPLPNAVAHSGQEADINAARAAIKLLEHHWNALELDKKHQKLVSYLVATGNCFIKQFWNPNKGEEIAQIDLKEANLDKGLNMDGTFKVEEVKSLHLGDTDAVIRTPFNIYPEPGKTDIDLMGMLGDAENMTTSEVFSTYGKKVAADKNIMLSVSDDIDSAIENGRYEEKVKPDSVTVKELYILPCRAFSKGLDFIWAGDVILSIKEECQSFPVKHFKLINVPGKFWGRGIIDDVVPLQKRWNRLLSKVEMHNDYYNDPPTMYDPDIIDADDWTTEPALLLPVENLANIPGKAVQVLEVPQIDGAIFKELDILDKQFETVPIINKVSFGQDSVNATSGRAINFLQEKDDDIIRPLTAQIEIGYTDVFKADFLLCQENYSEDRGFAVVGEDNKSEWVDFTMADLQSGVDVGVEPGSAMPKSKIAQQSMVLDMVHEGFFDDPNTGKRDYMKALKYMEFGSVSQFYEDSTLDINQAKRENEKLEKDNAMPAPEDWHNHFVHVTEHNKLRKTVDYEEYSDEQKQIMANHVAQHIAFMQPQKAAQPAVSENQNMPSDKEVMAFLQELQRNNPQEIEKLKAMPPDQRNAEILKLMQQGQGQAQPQQQQAVVA